MRYRNNELVRVCGTLYGTIVCTLDYQRDDITTDDVGAVVLLCTDFRDDNDNGLRELSIEDLSKQYDC